MCNYSMQLFDNFQRMLLPPANEVWGKVMFLQASVILLTGGGGALRGGCASLVVETPPNFFFQFFFPFFFPIFFSIIFQMVDGQWAGGTHPTGMHSCT